MEEAVGVTRMVLLVAIPRTAGVAGATRAMEDTVDGFRTARAVGVKETTMKEPTMEDPTTMGKATME